MLFSRIAERDRLNLDYSFKKACEVIAQLTVESWKRTVEYKGTLPLDVYSIAHAHSSGSVDPLYIKLRITASGKVRVESFHRDR